MSNQHLGAQLSIAMLSDDERDFMNNVDTLLILEDVKASEMGNAKDALDVLAIDIAFEVRMADFGLQDYGFLQADA